MNYFIILFGHFSRYFYKYSVVSRDMVKRVRTMEICQTCQIYLFRLYLLPFPAFRKEKTKGRLRFYSFASDIYILIFFPPNKFMNIFSWRIYFIPGHGKIRSLVLFVRNVLFLYTVGEGVLRAAGKGGILRKLGGGFKECWGGILRMLRVAGEGGFLE